MSREKKNSTTGPAKRKRKGGVPLGVHHSKLSIPDDLIPPNKVGRWVNDVDNRIAMALNGDYEFVTSTKDSHVGDDYRDGNSDIGSKISKVVGSTKSGEPMRAYLMMIDREWYEEDQAKKQEKVDGIDRAIKTPGFGAGQKGLDKSNMYGKIDYKA